MSYSSMEKLFLAVEIAVAIAGRAFQCVQGAFSSCRHELAASIHSVAADDKDVILQALPIPTVPDFYDDGCTLNGWQALEVTGRWPKTLVGEMVGTKGFSSQPEEIGHAHAWWSHAHGVHGQAWIWDFDRSFGRILRNRACFKIKLNSLSCCTEWI